MRIGNSKIGHHTSKLKENWNAFNNGINFMLSALRSSKPCTTLKLKMIEIVTEIKKNPE